MCIVHAQKILSFFFRKHAFVSFCKTFQVNQQLLLKTNVIILFLVPWRIYLLVLQSLITLNQQILRRLSIRHAQVKMPVQEERATLVHKRSLVKRRITNLEKKISTLVSNEEVTDYDMVCAKQFLCDIQNLDQQFQSIHEKASVPNSFFAIFRT